MKACGIQSLGQEDAVFPEEAVSGLGIDSYTLKDIEDAIRTPLRDYRDQFDGALLKSDVLEIDDLQIGDELYGTVRNVVAFGAFVDIGLHSDGLVHITRMSRQRVEDPSTILSVGDVIKVWVVEIDKEKERVGLEPPFSRGAHSAGRPRGRIETEVRAEVRTEDPEKGITAAAALAAMAETAIGRAIMTRDLPAWQMPTQSFWRNSERNTR